MHRRRQQNQESADIRVFVEVPMAALLDDSLAVSGGQ
jgi:hypothetical protein